VLDETTSGERLQVYTRQAEQELTHANAEVGRLRSALQAAENRLAAKDERIEALHSDLHLLDARKGDLQVAVADASGAATRAANTTAALEARVRALQAQLADRDEVEALLREQLVQARVRFYIIFCCRGLCESLCFDH
jgi:chromosome segregation ATPase